MSVIALHRQPTLTGARAHALAEGDLVDVTEVAKRLRFRHPVACTREVWDDCIYWDDAIEANKSGFSAQETDGRLRDVLWMALQAARRSKSSQTYFTVRRVPPTGEGFRALDVTLALSIGPGDAGEPVLTISLPPQ